MATPLINGKSYSWAHVRFPLFGFTVEGIAAIRYGKKQEKVNNYGRGNEPVSRGTGKVEYEGSITLEMKEVERIIASLPAGKSLLDIAPFDIAVTYAGDGITLVNHLLQQCEFTENKRDIKTGDTTIEVELPLIIGGIRGL